VLRVDGEPFPHVDFGAHVDRFTVTVSNDGLGRAAIELRLDDPAGPRVGAVAAPFTGGRYEWTAADVTVRGAEGVHDLYLVLTGAVRVARFSFARRRRP
jgi:beta-glucosidase